MDGTGGGGGGGDAAANTHPCVIKKLRVKTKTEWISPVLDQTDVSCLINLCVSGARKGVFSIDDFGAVTAVYRKLCQAVGDNPDKFELVQEVESAAIPSVFEEMRAIAGSGGAAAVDADDTVSDNNGDDDRVTDDGKSTGSATQCLAPGSGKSGKDGVRKHRSKRKRRSKK